jgi:hypothetical protein
VSALDSAVAAAARFGLRVDGPVVLRDTNNVVIWLAPEPVVAKVGSSAPLGREREVALELWRAGAPVVGPATGLPERVHQEGDDSMSFWTYLPQPPDASPRAERVATRLAELHGALQNLPASRRGALGSFIAELHLARFILDDRDRAAALSLDDRALLARCVEWSIGRLAPVSAATVLHGSPHPYNVLTTGTDVRFIDFETVCLGPIEWDLAHQDDGVAAAYPGDVDEKLLAAARFATSVKTAAFCWADAHRGDLRHHAEHHTEALRRHVLLP